MAPKIDVHTHALPDFFVESLQKLSQENTGIPKIEWSMDLTRQMNAKLGVGTSMLSLSAPGPEVAAGQAGARNLARQYNEWASKEMEADPAQIGFFAAVPSLFDTEGALAEIKHSFDNLHADGVCFFTTYDGNYLGDWRFEPLWKELNARSAVVFVHPNMPPGFKLATRMMQPPAFDFPHETGRTAAHMIVTGMKARYPNVKIILSHGGGTLPLLSERVALLNSTLFFPLMEEQSPKSAEEILSLAKSFYFDTALCGTKNVLDLLVPWAPQDRILFGSDFPYATVEAEDNTKKLEEYSLSNDVRVDYYAANGLKLFPRLKKEKRYQEF